MFETMKQHDALLKDILAPGGKQPVRGRGGSREAREEPVEVVQGLDNGLNQVSAGGGRHG